MNSTTESLISFTSFDVGKAEQIELFRAMLKPRMIEEKMISLLRQGQISKWFSGIGQEAISVGTTMALEPDEMLFTLHRNLGVFTTREIPLKRLFGQWQGKKSGFTNGRDRSFHFGAPEYGIIGMISHLGPQLSLADGVALAQKLKRKEKVVVAFTGDGGTSEGDFHEALNVAAVWQLPVIFIIENNGYGLSTPVNEQYRCEHLAHKGIGYGMEAHILDGNNILEMYSKIRDLAHRIRKNPKPVLLECKTFRMRGHEEASGTKYVPQSLMDSWAQKDPLLNFQNYLLEQKIITEQDISIWSLEIKEEIQYALASLKQEELVQSTTENELDAVYIPHTYTDNPPGKSTQEMRLIDAISDGLDQAMQRHPDLVLMGQDIADYGGVFKITDGLKEKYGKERVRNTPLCESAIIGCGLGLSIAGIKSMVEMQFGDFVTVGFNQIVNNVAKLQYRWSGRADMVIRMPTGAGTGAGPFHSQSNEAWFFHTPGLKIVYPSNAFQAKGLLLAAFEDPNPVMYFEHKALYRSEKSQVPNGYYTIPIGQAEISREGREATIITYGLGVHWAKEIVEQHNWDIEIIDLVSLVPLDYETILQSINKTHRALILHEDTMAGGIGGEISSYLAEHAFHMLDAPIMRTASLDTPVPFAKTLEKEFLANARLERDILHLLSY